MSGRSILGAKSADISIVIITHNRPGYLVEAVGSVMRQTCAPREIIVVDDGSTWETKSALNVFGSRVTYVRQENAGQQVARNCGVEHAQAQWVATLDDDDLYTPKYVEKVSAAIEGCDADIIYTDHRKFSVGEPYEHTNFENAPGDYWFGMPYSDEGWSFIGKFPVERLTKWIAFYPSTMTVQKDFYRSLGGYKPQFRGIKSEDIEFLVRALVAGRLAAVWSPVVDYRLHAGNDTRSVYQAALGRLTIFEAIRADPATPPALVAALDADLPTRRAWALDFAFKVGDFDLVRHLGKQFRAEDWTSSRRARYWIAGFPVPANALTADFFMGLNSFARRAKRSQIATD